MRNGRLAPLRNLVVYQAFYILDFVMRDVSPILCYEWCVRCENGCCVRTLRLGLGKDRFFLLKHAGYDTKETMEFRSTLFRLYCLFFVFTNPTFYFSAF